MEYIWNIHMVSNPDSSGHLSSCILDKHPDNYTVHMKTLPQFEKFDLLLPWQKSKIISKVPEIWQCRWLWPPLQFCPLQCLPAVTAATLQPKPGGWLVELDRDSSTHALYVTRHCALLWLLSPGSCGQIQSEQCTPGTHLVRQTQPSFFTLWILFIEFLHMPISILNCESIQSYTIVFKLIIVGQRW